MLNNLSHWMKHILSIVLAASLTSPLHAQTGVVPYQPGVTPDGITYFLPQTRLCVVVKATRKHYEPGEFADYAQRFMRLADAVQQPRDEWELEGMELLTYGTADPAKAFTIKLNPKSAAPLVSLTPDGRLLSVNAATEWKETPLPAELTERLEEVGTEAENYKTQEILRAGSRAKMAELTAAEIYDIRDNRNLLTKGQADFMPKDGEQLRLMLQNLDERETALLHLFTGSVTTDRFTKVYELTPSPALGQTVLFGFSKYLGFVAPDDPAGKPVTLSLSDLTPPAPPAPETEKDKKAKEVLDLRYIVPGRVEVLAAMDGQTLAKGTFPMAQYGRVEHLGGELFNKKFTTHVWISPLTGGVEKIDAVRPE